MQILRKSYLNLIYCINCTVCTPSACPISLSRFVCGGKLRNPCRPFFALKDGNGNGNDGQAEGRRQESARRPQKSSPGAGSREDRRSVQPRGGVAGRILRPYEEASPCESDKKIGGRTRFFHNSPSHIRLDVWYTTPGVAESQPAARTRPVACGVMCRVYVATAVRWPVRSAFVGANLARGSMICSKLFIKISCTICSWGCSWMLLGCSVRFLPPRPRQTNPSRHRWPSSTPPRWRA